MCLVMIRAVLWLQDCLRGVPLELRTAAHGEDERDG